MIDLIRCVLKTNTGTPQQRGDGVGNGRHSADPILVPVAMYLGFPSLERPSMALVFPRDLVERVPISVSWQLGWELAPPW